MVKAEGKRERVWKREWLGRTLPRQEGCSSAKRRPLIDTKSRIYLQRPLNHLQPLIRLLFQTSSFLNHLFVLILIFLLVHPPFVICLSVYFFHSRKFSCCTRSHDLTHEYFVHACDISYLPRRCRTRTMAAASIYHSVNVWKFMFHFVVIEFNLNSGV